MPDFKKEDSMAEANRAAKLEMNTETSLTLGEEGLAERSMPSTKRKRKNTEVEDDQLYVQTLFTAASLDSDAHLSGRCASQKLQAH